MIFISIAQFYHFDSLPLLRRHSIARSLFVSYEKKAALLCGWRLAYLQIKPMFMSEWKVKATQKTEPKRLEEWRTERMWAPFGSSTSLPIWCLFHGFSLSKFGCLVAVRKSSHRSMHESSIRLKSGVFLLLGARERLFTVNFSACVCVVRGLENVSSKAKTKYNNTNKRRILSYRSCGWKKIALV